MTVGQGCLLLALAFVAGVGVGLAIGHYTAPPSFTDTRRVGAYAVTPFMDDLESRLRKGGPPSPEAMDTGDTTDTADSGT